MADSTLDPARRKRNKRINAKWAKSVNRNATKSVAPKRTRQAGREVKGSPSHPRPAVHDLRSHASAAGAQRVPTAQRQRAVGELHGSTIHGAGGRDAVAEDGGVVGDGWGCEEGEYCCCY
jgi:hypothetical protein